MMSDGRHRRLPISAEGKAKSAQSSKLKKKVENADIDGDGEGMPEKSGRCKKKPDSGKHKKRATLADGSLHTVSTTKGKSDSDCDQAKDSKKIQEDLKSLDDAIDAMQYSKAKSAYLEAAENARDVINVESNPRWFLHAEDYNAQAAAKRLVTYWDRRKMVFGNRHFLKRMTLTEDGAMNSSNVGTLNDGVLSVLPKDEGGRYVLCVDEGRRKTACTTESRLRCVFYILSVLAELQQSSGSCDVSVMIVLMSTNYEFELVKDLTQLLQYAMPLRCPAVHVVCIPPGGTRLLFEETIFPLLVKSLTGDFEHRAQFHINESQTELLKSLNSSGFSLQGLPTSIGGKWGTEGIKNWLKRRISYERQMDESKPSSASRSSGPKKDQKLQESSDSESEATSKKRKSRDEGEETSDSAMRDSQGNEASIDDDMEDEARQELLRKRNAIYSKRKYYKKKLEVERLEQTRYELEADNRDLVKENEKLEKLLKEAKEEVRIHESLDLLKKTDPVAALPSAAASTIALQNLSSPLQGAGGLASLQSSQINPLPLRASDLSLSEQTRALQESQLLQQSQLLRSQLSSTLSFSGQARALQESQLLQQSQLLGSHLSSNSNLSAALLLQQQQHATDLHADQEQRQRQIQQLILGIQDPLYQSQLQLEEQMKIAQLLGGSGLSGHQFSSGLQRDSLNPRAALLEQLDNTGSVNRQLQALLSSNTGNSIPGSVSELLAARARQNDNFSSIHALLNNSRRDDALLANARRDDAILANARRDDAILANARRDDALPLNARRDNPLLANARREDSLRSGQDIQQLLLLQQQQASSSRDAGNSDLIEYLLARKHQNGNR